LFKFEQSQERINIIYLSQMVGEDITIEDENREREEFKERKKINLLFLHHIRLLIQENLNNTPHYDTLNTFPIVELKGEVKKYENSGCLQYLGFCDSKHADYAHITDTLQHSRVNKTYRIRMALKYNSEGKKHLIPIQLLLPTFIHELAHSITPGVQEYRYGDERNGNGKRQRLKKWHFNAHSSLFYTNYAMLLRVAEDLEIYRVPSQSKKFSEKTLRRMDMIDLLSSPELCGSSPYSILSLLPIDTLRSLRDLKFNLASIMQIKEEEEEVQENNTGGDDDVIEDWRDENDDDNPFWTKSFQSNFFSNKKNNVMRSKRVNSKKKLETTIEHINLCDENEEYLDEDAKGDHDVIYHDVNVEKKMLQKTKKDIIDAVQNIESQKELRLTITNNSGQTKVIFCVHRRIEELHKKAKQKYRHKFTKIYLMPERRELLRDEDIKLLHTDSLLLFTS
jgi:hypothetical protein